MKFYEFREDNLVSAKFPAKSSLAYQKSQFGIATLSLSMNYNNVA